MSTNSMTIARDRILEAKKMQIAADTAGRELSAEESARIFQLLDEAKARQKIAETEEVAPRLTSAVGPNHRFSTIITPGSEAGPSVAPLSRPANGRRYSDLFGSSLSTDGFRDFAEYLTAVRSGGGDHRLIHATQSRISGGAGGFLVPQAFSSMLLDASIENEIVRPLANVIPVEGESLTVGTLDGSDNSAGTPYGIGGTWVAETGTNTVQSAKFRAVKLTPHKCMIYCDASTEILQDGVGFTQTLTSAMTRALGWTLDRAFLVGTGAGQPQGAISSANPALIVVVKESGQTAATICIENVLKMFSRFHPACAASPSACWIGNVGITPQLYSLSLGVGAAGQPVFLPPDGLAGRPRASLLGIPIYLTEKVPALGSQGDLSLVDLRQYLVGLRADVVLETSNAPSWTTDVQSFRVRVRADGMGAWSSAFAPVNGSTLSWAVTLGARA